MFLGHPSHGGTIRPWPLNQSQIFQTQITKLKFKYFWFRIYIRVKNLVRGPTGPNRSENSVSCEVRELLIVRVQPGPGYQNFLGPGFGLWIPAAKIIVTSA